jgi:hypothetical protein
VFRSPNELAPFAIDLFNDLLLALLLPTLALGEPLSLGIDPFPEVSASAACCLSTLCSYTSNASVAARRANRSSLFLACLDLCFGQHQIPTRAHEQPVALDIAPGMQRKIQGFTPECLIAAAYSLTAGVASCVLLSRMDRVNPYIAVRDNWCS